MFSLFPVAFVLYPLINGSASCPLKLIPLVNEIAFVIILGIPPPHHFIYTTGTGRLLPHLTLILLAGIAFDESRLVILMKSK